MAAASRVGLYSVLFDLCHCFPVVFGIKLRGICKVVRFLAVCQAVRLSVTRGLETVGGDSKLRVVDATMLTRG